MDGWCINEAGHISKAMLCAVGEKSRKGCTLL